MFRWREQQWCWVERNTPAIPALGRWRQEDHEFKTSLYYIALSPRKKEWKRKREGEGVGERNSVGNQNGHCV
jgi:hypothetical protein